MRTFPLAVVIVALAACAQNTGQQGMTAQDACKRADVKDKILTEIANAVVSKTGNVIALFGGPEAFNAASEDFKSRSTIENPRVSDSPLADQKIYEVHCTVDLATVNTAKDSTPVEFRNVEFTIHYNNGTTDLGTEDYTLIPTKATFFRTIFVNGVPAAEYQAQQQATVAPPSPSPLSESQEAPAATTEASSTATAEDGSQESVRAAAEAADSAAQAASKPI